MFCMAVESWDSGWANFSKCFCNGHKLRQQQQQKEVLGIAREDT